MFLTPEELKGMTGTAVRRLQRAWLDQHGIKYTVSTKGNLNVLRKVVEVAHGFIDAQVESKWEPNRNVFKGRSDANRLPSH